MDKTDIFSSGDTSDSAWTFATVSELIATVLALVLNTGVLLVFLLNKPLRTSFTVYIIAILIFNLLYTATHNPLDIVRARYRVWPLGAGTCILHLYSGWVLAGIIMHGHVLVTFNRIWAFAFPVSYREKHTKRAAKCVCVAACVYVHIIALPGVILDGSLKSKGYIGTCYLDIEAQRAWAIVTVFLIFDLPILIIVGAYPFLWYKQKRRIAEIASNTNAVVDRNGSVSPVPVAKDSRMVKEGYRAFLVLTFLTVSIFICWTPGQVYYTVLTVNPALESFGVDNWTSFLYSLQAVCDPLLFVLTLKSLRHTVKTFVLRAWRKESPKVTVDIQSGAAQ